MSHIKSSNQKNDQQWAKVMTYNLKIGQLSYLGPAEKGKYANAERVLLFSGVNRSGSNF